MRRAAAAAPLAFFCVAAMLLAIRPAAHAQEEGDLYLPLIAAPAARIVIAAAHVDSVITGEPDEAILLWNAGARDSHSPAGS